MKKIFFSALAIGVITFTACNSGGTKNEHEGHDMNKTKTDTAQHVSTADDVEVTSGANVVSRVVEGIVTVTPQVTT